MTGPQTASVEKKHRKVSGSAHCSHSNQGAHFAQVAACFPELAKTKQSLRPAPLIFERHYDSSSFHGVVVDSQGNRAMRDYTLIIQQDDGVSSAEVLAVGCADWRSGLRGCAVAGSLGLFMHEGRGSQAGPFLPRPMGSDQRRLSGSCASPTSRPYPRAVRSPDRANLDRTWCRRSGNSPAALR